MHRIAVIVAVSIIIFAGQAVAQGPFDDWVWVSAHRQGCIDCSLKVPPGDPRAQRASNVTVASAWLEADTPVGASTPLWLHTGALLDDVLQQMPENPHRAESGGQRTYTWIFQDRSRIVLMFEDSVLQAIDIRGLIGDTPAIEGRPCNCRHPTRVPDGRGSADDVVRRGGAQIRAATPRKPERDDPRPAEYRGHDHDAASATAKPPEQGDRKGDRRCASRSLQPHSGRHPGLVGDRITAAFHECARLTGYTEDPVDHTAGMIACRTRLRDAGRLLGVSGHGFRWTSTALDVMFTDTDVSASVATYAGATLEVQDTDGNWVPASYECDYDHEIGQIVDVRTAEGWLR